MLEIIAAIAIYAIGSSKTAQSILFGIMIIIFLIVIAIFERILNSPIPKKEEGVKIIYIIQNGTSGEIRVHSTKEDKTQPPPIEEDKPPKELNTLQRAMKTVQDIAEFIIVTTVMLIIIALLGLLIFIAIGFIIGYIKNPSL